MPGKLSASRDRTSKGSRVQARDMRLKYNVTPDLHRESRLNTELSHYDRSSAAVALDGNPNRESVIRDLKMDPLVDDQIGQSSADSNGKLLQIFKDPKQRRLLSQQRRERKALNDARLDEILSKKDLGGLKNNSEFQDCLMFPSCYQVKSDEELRQQELDNTRKVIVQLYERLVPEYLLEDHPKEIPDATRDLIKKQSGGRGQGKTPDQMDIEFAILFRKEEMKRGRQHKSVEKKNKQYRHLYSAEGEKQEISGAFNVEVLSPTEEKEMKEYVDKKQTEKLALKLRKQVLQQFERKKKFRELMRFEEEKK